MLRLCESCYSKTFGPRVVGLQISRHGDGTNFERRLVKNSAIGDGVPPTPTGAALSFACGHPEFSGAAPHADRLNGEWAYLSALSFNRASLPCGHCTGGAATPLQYPFARSGEWCLCRRDRAHH